jgi:hypothetical protein
MIALLIRYQATIPPIANGRRGVNEAMASPNAPSTRLYTAALTTIGATALVSVQTPSMPSLVVNTAPRYCTSSGVQITMNRAVASAASFASG